MHEKETQYASTRGVLLPQPSDLSSGRSAGRSSSPVFVCVCVRAYKYYNIYTKLPL
jgi:hypothetical protein